MTTETETALETLRRAVLDKGPRPAYHDHIERETRRQWPSLMKAVDFVLAAYERERQP